MRILDIGVGKIAVADSLRDEFPASGCDAALVAEQMAKEVYLDREIAGVSGFAASVARLTANFDYPLLCGCVTRLGSVRHASVMTFVRGRLADIADRTLDLSGGFCESDTIKVLRLKRFDLGVMVDTDVLLASNWRKLSEKCDAVACVGLCGSDAEFNYVPTLSSLFAKPYAAAFSSGEIMWGNPNDGYG